MCAGESEARSVIEAEGFVFHPLEIDRGGTNPLRDGKTLRALGAVYRRVKPDLVHHVTIKPVLYGGICARFLGIPAVHAVSGLGYVFIQNQGDGRAKLVLRHVLERVYRFVFSAKRARVIFQNSSDRAQFVERGLVAQSKTRLVPGSGVDPNRFRATPLPEGPPILLLPARLLFDKGLQEFVDAARALRARHPEWRFVLAGRIDPGNPAAATESVVRGWVDEGVVEWWTGLGPEEMPAAYARASLVVLPSYREGLPLAVAEAAACGRAVVTTDVPGCRDAIVPERTGWLVPARDAVALERTIELALSARTELVRRSVEAAAFARERFSSAAIHEAILSIYQELDVNP